MAVTNPTDEWKDLTIPVQELHVVTPDGETHVETVDQPLTVRNLVLELQGVQSAKWGLVNERPAQGGAVGDGIMLSFSPSGKNPNVDPSTAKLSAVKGIWRVELAPKQSFRVPLLFDCPQDSRPEKMTWPGVGSFTF